MNKQEANLAARAEALTSYNCLDVSFFVSSTAFEVVGKLSKYPWRFYGGKLNRKLIRLGFEATR